MNRWILLTVAILAGCTEKAANDADNHAAQPTTTDQPFDEAERELIVGPGTDLEDVYPDGPPVLLSR